VHIKNAICIHEEDAGLLWKHTDFRPDGRVHSVRSRRLVISMICTVANYEYCFYYYFYQDGSIELEIKLTGILNVYLLAEGESPAPFGIQVAKGINAQYHQHIFSIRIDPIIDGVKNSVVETDIVPYDFPTGSAENFAGNAFIAQETTLTEPTLIGRKFDATKDRRWRIVNPFAVPHSASGKAPGYTLGIKGATIELLAKPDSWASKRAAFARGCLWVVPERKEDEEDPTKLAEERIWPAGKYVPQTRDDPADSITRWANEGGKVDGEDILVFATIGARL
jgi:primary-amine oxidase